MFQEALVIVLNGYNHKMKVLAERAVKHLANFAETLRLSNDGEVCMRLAFCVVLSS